MLGQVRALGIVALAALPIPTRAEAPPPPPPPRVETPEYAAALTGPAKLEFGKGRPAAFEVKVEARGKFHLNADYPSNFKVAGDAAAVRYPRDKLDRNSGLSYEECADAKQTCRARATVAFLPERAGATRVGGILAFSVCDQDRCLIEKVELALPITVR